MIKQVLAFAIPSLLFLFVPMTYSDTPPRRPNWLEVSSTTNATTTSGTDVALTGMAVTATLPGTYVCWFSATSTSSGTNNMNTYTIYNGATAVTASARLITTATTVLLGLGVDTKVVNTQATLPTVTAGTSLNVKWNTTGGTATTGYRTLTCTKGS